MAKKVGPGSKRVRSTAVRQAGKLQKVRGRPKAKPSKIEDERESQRIRERNRVLTPALEKGLFEKIPGTRIQTLLGGTPVRIVVADGKQFNPCNARAARLHIAKVAQQAEELARIRGEAAPPSAPTPSSSSIKKVSRQQNANSSSSVSKKQRIANERAERQKRREEAYAQAIAEKGRQMISEDHCFGKVLDKVKGEAWVEASISEEICRSLVVEFEQTKARAGDAGISKKSAVIPIAFGDIPHGIHLSAGTHVKFKVFKDVDGVGGCDVHLVEAASNAVSVAQNVSTKTSLSPKQAEETPVAVGCEATEEQPPIMNQRMDQQPPIVNQHSTSVASTSATPTKDLARMDAKTSEVTDPVTANSSSIVEHKSAEHDGLFDADSAQLPGTEGASCTEA